MSISDAVIAALLVVTLGVFYITDVSELETSEFITWHRANPIHHTINFKFTVYPNENSRTNPPIDRFRRIGNVNKGTIEL